MILRLICLILCTSLTSSCQSEVTSTFWVNSVKVDCDAGAGKMECLQIYRGDTLENASWENFYSNIDGFEFKSGQYQKIEVLEIKLNEENVPADVSSINYSLVKIVKTQDDKRFLLNGNWELKTINGEDVVFETHGPSLTFDIEQMRVSGSDGCNRLNGSIESLTSSAIQFGNFMGTLMACPEDITALANNFKNALSEVNAYKLDDENNLSLSNSNSEQILSFTKTN